MIVAMDVARQQKIASSSLAPATLRAVAKVLKLPSTCSTPALVIARAQRSLLALSMSRATDPRRTRWLAVASMIGVPADQLPEPVSPAVVEAIRWQRTATSSLSTRARDGLAALHQGTPIPTELIDEAIRSRDRASIIAWLAHGAWDERFEAVCGRFTDQEIGMLVRAGVLPHPLVQQVFQRWKSDKLPWEAFPLTMWDTASDVTVARAGRARTAATQLIRYPDLRTDDRLIAAAAQDAQWAAHVLCGTDIRDDRLIAAAAQDAQWAADVLIQYPNIRDDRLIAAAAQDARRAAHVLCNTDIRDDRLIAAAAQDAQWAAHVLCYTDIRDARFIAAIVQKQNATFAADVLIHCPDIRDASLIPIAAQDSWHAAHVLCNTDIRDARFIAIIVQKKGAREAARVLSTCPDIRDASLIPIAAQEPWYAGQVLCNTDIRDDRLIAAAARDAQWAARVLCHSDIRDDRLIAAAARDAQWAAHVLCHSDIRDDRLIASAARDPQWAAHVLMKTTLCDEPLLVAAVQQRWRITDIITQRPDLRDHPQFVAVLGNSRHG